MLMSRFVVDGCAALAVPLDEQHTLRREYAAYYSQDINAHLSVFHCPSDPTLTKESVISASYDRQKPYR